MRVVGTICGSDEVSVIDVKDGIIAAIEPAEADVETGSAVLGGPDVMVCPALLDTQVNGFHGHDLNGDDTTADQVAALLDALYGTGVGLYCPTVGSKPFETLSAGLRAIAEACEDERIAASTVGVHMEGPYISPEDGPRGAHPVEHVREPDWDEFRRLQDAAGGRIRIVTLAPERPGAIEFIEKLADAGIVPAIGHTAASAEDIRAAVGAGARLSTHLGNGAHALIPRHPNYIWEQLAADELWASIIPDGHHLPPSVVKCMIRCKGPERTILVSDAVRYAGLEPGEYESAGRVVELTPEGKIQLKGTPYLAGSALELSRGVGNVVRFANVSLPQAVQMATLNPARLLGIDERFGTVEVGKEASLLLFRWGDRQKAIEVRATMVRGEVVHRAP